MPDARQLHVRRLHCLQRRRHLVDVRGHAAERRCVCLENECRRGRLKVWKGEQEWATEELLRPGWLACRGPLSESSSREGPGARAGSLAAPTAPPLLTGWQQIWVGTLKPPIQRLPVKQITTRSPTSNIAQWKRRRGRSWCLVIARAMVMMSATGKLHRIDGSCDKRQATTPSPSHSLFERARLWLRSTGAQRCVQSSALQVACRHRDWFITSC